MRWLSDFISFSIGRGARARARGACTVDFRGAELGLQEIVLASIADVDRECAAAFEAGGGARLRPRHP